MTFSVKIPDGRISDFISREAERRACQPEQMVLALLSCVSNADLADAVLDGVDPAAMPAINGRLQVRVLRAIVAFKAPNGTSPVSFKQIAAYLGLNTRGPVANAIKALRGKGLVEIIAAGSSGIPSRYRVTERADLFLKEIGGGR